MDVIELQREVLQERLRREELDLLTADLEPAKPKPKRGYRLYRDRDAIRFVCVGPEPEMTAAAIATTIRLFGPSRTGALRRSVKLMNHGRTVKVGGGPTRYVVFNVPAVEELAQKALRTIGKADDEEAGR